MSSDWTGEPPGELMLRKTASNLSVPNASSISAKKVGSFVIRFESRNLRGHFL
jgi:hypothetical protein